MANLTLSEELFESVKSEELDRVLLVYNFSLNKHTSSIRAYQLLH
jgi:F0F1-type ATP synthase gamma subunit